MYTKVTLIKAIARICMKSVINVFEEFFSGNIDESILMILSIIILILRIILIVLNLRKIRQINFTK